MGAYSHTQQQNSICIIPQVFGYYSGPVPNKGDLECSCVCTKDNGLLERSIISHSDSTTDTNSRIVPVGGETYTESSTKLLNTEPINFILASSVEDVTDDKLPTNSYNDYIDTIQHTNEIIDNNIIVRRTFLLSKGDDGEVIRTQVKACAAQFDQ